MPLSVCAHLHIVGKKLVHVLWSLLKHIDYLVICEDVYHVLIVEHLRKFLENIFFLYIIRTSVPPEI